MLTRLADRPGAWRKRARYETILAAEPGHARAHYALAIPARQTADDHHIARLRTALARAEAPVGILHIRYALAKEMEDIGNPAAFDHLKAAYDRHRRSIGYRFAQDAAIFDAIEAAFSTQPPAALPTTASGANPSTRADPCRADLLPGRYMVSHIGGDPHQGDLRRRV